MGDPDDTIAALATPPGVAARAIVRTDGPRAFEIARALTGTIPEPCVLTPAPLEAAAAAVDLPPRLPIHLLAFRAPRSHTGNDTVEYHLPGNPLIARRLLDALLTHGCRAAEPGEFTARAYFNGRVSLDAAEATQASIAATTDVALAAAARLRSGDLARRLSPVLDDLANLLALCEAGIDFVDEPDVVAIAPAEARRRIADLESGISDLKSQCIRLDRPARPPTVALVGRPNAGKSTLLNVLAGRERAVASAVAGTTRDVLSATVALPGGAVEVWDLPGLDAAANDELDASVQCAARSRAAEADVLVLLLPPDAADAPEFARVPDLVVWSKLDLVPGSTETPERRGSAARNRGKAASLPSIPPGLSISARTGQNLDALRDRLNDLAFASDPGDRIALAARHAAALDDALDALSRADAALDAPELAAAGLRDALDVLGTILAPVTPDDVLARIFAGFCVGK